MVGNRIYCRLENAMAAIIDYRGKTPRKASSGIPLITAKVVKGGRIKTPTEFIAKADYSSWMRRGIPRSGDVVVTTEAPLGEVAQLTDQCVALAQRLILLRGKSGILDNRFLKFLMQSDDVQDQLRARATGTTVLGIKQKELREIELALPPPPEQRAIAHILGTLDDKIELNRRMNQTLEEMARALFRSWFVNFDPVRAKAALKRSSLITPPSRGSDWTVERARAYLDGMDDSISDLFPDRLVDSELGPIPEGWEVGVFGDVVRQKNERIGDRDAVVLSAVSSGELVRSDDHFSKRVYSRSIAKYLAVQQWEIAFNPSRINIGSVGMLKEPCLGAVSPVYVVVRPDSAYCWYLNFTLRLLQTREWITTLATGSVRQSLSYYDFASIPCVIPPHYVVECFNNEWIDMRASRLAHASQTRALATMRETLLPKLISGEMQVGR